MGVGEGGVSRDRSFSCSPTEEKKTALQSKTHSNGGSYGKLNLGKLLHIRQHNVSIPLAPCVCIIFKHSKQVPVLSNHKEQVTSLHKTV